MVHLVLKRPRGEAGPLDFVRPTLAVETADNRAFRAVR